MNVLIVDDEQNARENLKIILDDYFEEINVLGMAKDVSEAAALVKEKNPDLVFLDINMPKEDGFKLYDATDGFEYEVIFITAHSEHALKALKKSAVDLLEKPLNIEELGEAIKKARVKLKSKDNKSLEEGDIRQIVRYTIQNTKSRIAIPTNEGLAIADFKEIIHIEAVSGYSIFYLTDGRQFVTSKNIKIFEDKLSGNYFFRIHKSHIINYKSHLKEFSRTGGNVVKLSNGKEFPVSRRKLPAFLDKLEQFE